MIVHARLVFKIPDGACLPELMGPVFNQLAYDLNVEGEDGPISLESCEIMGAVPEEGNNPMNFFDSRKIGPSFFSRVEGEPGTIFVIRIVVEGTETSEQRFDMMDALIEHIGGDSSDEHLNVFFFFDTGWEFDWIPRSMDLIFNPVNPEIPRRARMDRISYTQWISREDRNKVLEHFRRSKK